MRKFKGAGTETITITGVEKLHGAIHNVVQDRIEAGTFMVAAAMTGGDVLIQDAIWEHNRPLIAKLLEMGVEVIDEDEGIRIRSQREKLKAVHVKTLPAGQDVGYGATYTTTADEVIGTIPIGYADGWTRDLQGFHVIVGWTALSYCWACVYGPNHCSPS